MERTVILLFHFIGFGLLFTTTVAGFLLNQQYKHASDLNAKAVILRSLRPIGLLSPIGIAIMLITGIGNMHSIGAGILTFGWLSAKIIFFALAAISGILFGVKSRKRTVLVQQMASGTAPATANQQLGEFDKQMSLFYVVMPILLAIILLLSIYGRLGGQ